ncbi:HER008Wp [Eremothecium sinecaudum]|uniref:HER008Wp n=1 Tax=Eremothecium sinecaudum TaxID=45286 RepID=A0A109UXF6_9SACH|nr:HER008Wp [Eremothecium sinecaudum]AMD21287.1 HER008Wp [Eremothecium sinecaudum]
MNSQKSLYHGYRVLLAAKEVVSGSLNIAKGSFSQWLLTSDLTRPLLSEFRCFYDKEWEKAKALSHSIHHQKPMSINSNSTLGMPKVGKKKVRHYSTQAKKLISSNDTEEKIHELQSSEVPSSRVSRLFHYGSLAAGVGISAAMSGLNQISKGQSPSLKSLVLSESNITRITHKFSKMRGAALKIGQMMSFQDAKVLPTELYRILSTVQNNAHYMPQSQLQRLLNREFGPGWEVKFSKFNKVPIAAASIGQVHNAILSDGTECVVKVQYPGVRDSIDSDLNNILMLLTATSLLPKGLFLDKTIANARTELKWECDYIREAECLKHFRELLQDDPVFVVPRVIEELTTQNVLTMTKMKGIEIVKLSEQLATQEVRNYICENIMRLCLHEVATYRYMQTDPNWANFLYNKETQKIELIDFGASRSYSNEFVHKYRKLLTHGTKGNREGAFEMSKELGYLTGLESQAMVNAHVDSIMTLCEPFTGDINATFDFSKQTVTDRIRGNIGLMLNQRLCPPPEETYSLHRKFSGVFLLCARLGAKVHCAKLFSEIFAVDDN